MEGDLGEAARVALALEREEAAELEAAAVAAAKKADEDELSEELAATAASLPVIPYEVVSKMKADAASERKVGDAAAAAAVSEQRARQTDHEAEFWGAGRRSGSTTEEARGESTADVSAEERAPRHDGTAEEEEEERGGGGGEGQGQDQDETIFFSR